MPTLLTVSMASSADPTAMVVQQAASIFLKNFVEKHWETYDETVPSLINDTDKAFIRANIIDAVVASNEQIRVQYLTVVRRIARSDFPRVWSDVLDKIVPLLQSGDLNKINAGVSCFLEISSWRGNQKQDAIDALHGQFFPILLNLAGQFVQHLDQPESQSIMKTILKSYFNAIELRFSKWLMTGDAFLGWSNLALQVIQSPVPAAVSALDAEEAKENPYWKMKKWAFHIHNKIMSRYGNNKLDGYCGESPDFAKAYMTNMAIPVLNVYLAQIHSIVQGNVPVTERIISLICVFIENSLRHKRTWEALKDQYMWILQHFVFPRICWTQSDAEMWEEDPHEYIRSHLDPFDDYYSGPAACTSLVIDLVKIRKKETFMPILGFINGVLTDAQSTPSQKDGALFLVGSLSSLLMDSKKTKGQMEMFISSFVLPELTSKQAHLRLRACWTLLQFDELQINDENNAVKALSGVLSCMMDAEFPVKVAGATAISGILKNDYVRKALPPYLPKVVETLLNLSNEIEFDSLSYALEDLVSEFAEELAPYAAQLCVQLRDTLMRSLESVVVNNEDGFSVFEDTDKAMAILGMLGTINTLVDTMNGKAETMAQLEAVLLPLIAAIFQHKLMDIYEETFTLLDSFTFGQKSISPALWQFFEVIFAVFQDAGSQYIPDMATSLDNYISYGKEYLLSNPQAMSIMVQIIQTVMTDDDFVESDWVHGCNLMESLMLHCPGKIDQFIPLFLQLTTAKMADKMEDGQLVPGLHAVTHNVFHLEVILNALYYNTALTIQELERLGASNLFFKNLLQFHEKFVRVHDKKLVVMAISALMNSNIAFEQLPASWQQNWASLLPVFLEALRTLPKAMEDRQKLKEETERDDHSTNDLGDYDEDEDVDYEDEGSDVEASGRRSYDDFGSNEDWDDDSDWEDADELEEEIYFETPLDNVDVPAIVKSAVLGIAHHQPTSFQRMTHSLSAEQQAFLHQIMQ